MHTFLMPGGNSDTKQGREYLHSHIMKIINPYPYIVWSHLRGIDSLREQNMLPRDFTVLSSHVASSSLASSTLYPEP